MQQGNGRTSVIADLQEMHFASVDDLAEAPKRGVWLHLLHRWQTGLLRAGPAFVRKRTAAQNQEPFELAYVSTSSPANHSLLMAKIIMPKSPAR